jgi:hypothetical protein
VSDHMRKWWQKRCRVCGKHPTEASRHNEPIDACLRLLPGVAATCCGHGKREHAYVMLRGGEYPILRGDEALAFFAHFGVGPLAK